jgi:hypothetical protein
MHLIVGERCRNLVICIHTQIIDRRARRSPGSSLRQRTPSKSAPPRTTVTARHQRSRRQIPALRSTTRQPATTSARTPIAGSPIKARTKRVLTAPNSATRAAPIRRLPTSHTHPTRPVPQRRPSRRT